MRICLATLLLACSETPDGGDPSSCTDEVCDEVDNDCDGEVDEGVIGSFFADDDNDGHGDPSASVTACQAPAGYATIGDDCDDTRIDVNPDSVEACDGVDNDCDLAVDDGLAYSDWYADNDGDGFGDANAVVSLCAQPKGFIADATDCDDANPARFPGAPELCNLEDDDCDGVEDDGCLFPLEDASFRLESPEDMANLGERIAVADVDGDGVADILTGAPLLGFYEGEAYVVLGPATGARTTDLADVTITTNERATLGSSIDGADADGDGVTDLIVGAYGIDTSYLFLGPVTGDRDVTDATARLVGLDDTTTGFDVAILPDADGDGSPDVAVSTLSGSFDSGTVYVASGLSTGTVRLSSDATYLYEGVLAGDYFGFAMADAGDVNGDGVQDLAIAAPFDGNGTVYVIEGGGPPGNHKADDASSAAIVRAGKADTDFGLPLSAADYDGDGSTDLFVTAMKATSSTGFVTGRVYGFLGPLSGELGDADASVTWEDAASETRVFGSGVAAGGDLDGDGSGEVVFCTTDPWGAAAVYVQIGLASGLVDASTLLTLAPEPSTKWAAGFGAASFVPDWDGDGAPEIALGAAHGVNSLGDPSGLVYVVGSDRLR